MSAIRAAFCPVAQKAARLCSRGSASWGSATRHLSSKNDFPSSNGAGGSDRKIPAANPNGTFEELLGSWWSDLAPELAMGAEERRRGVRYVHIAAPVAGLRSIGCLDLDIVRHVLESEVDLSLPEDALIQAAGRNSRKPKKANKGRRPCSHVRRRNKRKFIKGR